MWAIRDAQGLNHFEKVFLYTVESHKEGMKKGWEKNAADMGFSKNTYYRTRDSLTGKDLIHVQRTSDGPTLYHVNLDSLTGNNWQSQVETDSLTGNGFSLTGNTDSLSGEYKEELKIEHKEEQKEQEEEQAADAALETKEEQQTTDSLFVGITEESQITKIDSDESSFVENKKRFVPKVIGGSKLSSASIKEAFDDYKRFRVERDIWTDEHEEHAPAAREKALDLSWYPTLDDYDRRIKLAFIEVSQAEPEPVLVAVGDDW